MVTDIATADLTDRYEPSTRHRPSTHAPHRPSAVEFLRACGIDRIIEDASVPSGAPDRKDTSFLATAS